MTKSEVVGKVEGLLDRLVGVEVPALESTYKKELLRLFKQVDAADAMVAGDALWDSLCERSPGKMQGGRHADLFRQMQRAWDEWRFLRENWEAVG